MELNYSTSTEATADSGEVEDTSASWIANFTSSTVARDTEDSTFMPTTNGQTAPTLSSSSSSSMPPDSSQGSKPIDQNAIIAAVLIAVLIIGLTLAGVCLARARRRRACRNGGGNGREALPGGAGRPGKTPRPSPANANMAVREPNPYTNACFEGTKEEMGEKMPQREEPAPSIAETVNSVRNKEDHWIIPLEELTEDDTASNFDTTRF